MERELRLTAELVPASTWYRTLRTAVPKATWDTIRRRVYAEHGYRCAVCGARGRLSCHEVWAYDDTSRVQRLSGFVALCDWCHRAKHLVHAAGLASEEKLDYERVVEHFMRVNGCGRQAFEEHRERALQEFRRRSAGEWRVDLGTYGRLAPE